MKPRFMFNVLLLPALFLATAPAALAHDTWYVNGVHGDDNNNCKTRQMACKTIGHAISLASSGDSIRVAPATYTENLTIGFSLKIIGSNAGTTIIDGGKSGSVVTIAAGNFHVTLAKLTMQNGDQYNEGGGIYNGAKLRVNRCTISGNSASSGAGIANEGTLALNTTSVSANSAPFGGGGIENDGTMTVNRSAVNENSGASGTGGGGGGIENNGTMMIRRSTISGNIAEGGTGGGYGGGVFNSAGTLVISDSTISGNRASGGVGGIGGGIFNDSSTTMTISRSTIVGNSVEHFGAGVMNYGTLALNNSTLNGNTASGETCGGGGIANGWGGFGGAVTINNSTLSGNNAPGCAYAGGIVNSSGTVSLQNSIVANSTPGGNCDGSETSGGYNISDDNTCNFNGSGDMNNTNPELKPLGGYGGPTATMPLPAKSPAIDAGNPNGCTGSDGHLLKTDQRGFPRPGPYDHHGCDIGAFENQRH
jgi:hypothetical protein